MSEIIEQDSWKNRGWAFIRQYGVLAAVGFFGLGLISYGVYSAIVPEKPTVEIVKKDVLGEQSELDDKIMVDVAGAVEKPGLYELTVGSRIGDALVRAGGISASADRGWVSRYVNLASKLEDGAKIYIPEQAEQMEIQGGRGLQNMGLININTASLSELESLVGIGEVRAKNIVENRPYSSTAELMSKAGLSESVYTKIKDEVAVY